MNEEEEQEDEEGKEFTTIRSEGIGGHCLAKFLYEGFLNEDDIAREQDPYRQQTIDALSRQEVLDDKHDAYSLFHFLPVVPVFGIQASLRYFEATRHCHF